MTRGGGSSPHGFPRSARIRKRREFLAVQGGGRRQYTRHFVVFVRSGAESRSRLGITASKRVGNAVVRNRWKRIIREAYRQLEIRSPEPVDIVVIARAGADPPELASARSELASVLRHGARSRKRKRSR